MNKILLNLIFAITICYGNAQSVSPEILSSGGDYFVSGGNQLEWTLGEVAIETYNGSGSILTQGFHQTDVSVVSIDDFNSFVNVDVFPNPVLDRLSIDLSKSGINSYELKLFDLNGKIIHFENLSNEKFKTIDMTKYSHGTYTLLIETDTQLNKSFKIIK